MEVLEKLLSTGEHTENNVGPQGNSIRDEDLELEPDFGGLSLKELAESEAQESNQAANSVSRPQLAGDCRFFYPDQDNRG